MKDGSGSFLKKRTKKLLAIGSGVHDEHPVQMNEVFLLLFVHKKKSLPS
jgi:hypothetical protein